MEDIDDALSDAGDAVVGVVNNVGDALNDAGSAVGPPYRQWCMMPRGRSKSWTLPFWLAKIVLAAATLVCFWWLVAWSREM